MRRIEREQGKKANVCQRQTVTGSGFVQGLHYVSNSGGMEKRDQKSFKHGNGQVYIYAHIRVKLITMSRCFHLPIFAAVRLICFASPPDPTRESRRRIPMALNKGHMSDSNLEPPSGRRVRHPDPRLLDSFKTIEGVFLGGLMLVYKCLDPLHSRLPFRNGSRPFKRLLSNLNEFILFLP